MVHRNARLTVHGRRLLVRRVRIEGMPVAHVAKAIGISHQCAHRWVARWDVEGDAGLVDRSSRPHRTPNRTSSDIEETVVEARRRLRVGPDRLADELGAPARTISRILPTFANMSLGVVHPTDIQQWVAQLDTQGYAPATIRKAFQLLSRIFSDAVQAGLIIRSPCRNITLPRVEGSEMRFLSPDEIGHLADTIDPRYRAMVLATAYTGCRFGEIAALDLGHYDPDRRLIRAERSLSEVRGYLRFCEPKTPAARRAITIPP